MSDQWWRGRSVCVRLCLIGCRWDCVCVRLCLFGYVCVCCTCSQRLKLSFHSPLTVQWNVAVWPAFTSTPLIWRKCGVFTATQTKHNNTHAWGIKHTQISSHMLSQTEVHHQDLLKGTVHTFQRHPVLSRLWATTQERESGDYNITDVSQRSFQTQRLTNKRKVRAERFSRNIRRALYYPYQHLSWPLASPFWIKSSCLIFFNLNYKV